MSSPHENHFESSHLTSGMHALFPLGFDSQVVVQEFSFPNLTCITPTDDAESASEFGLDRSTRFALTLRELLDKSAAYKEIEVVQLASQLRQELGRPTLVAPQTVDYWSSGRPLRISRTNSVVGSSRRIRTRTYLYLRAFFLAAGILVAAAAVTAFLYYRNHVWVQLFAGPLNSINGNAVIEVYEENLDVNQDRLIGTQDLYRNGATRLRLPAVDLILVVRRATQIRNRERFAFPSSRRAVFLSKRSVTSSTFHRTTKSALTLGWLTCQESDGCRVPTALNNKFARVLD